MNKEPIHVSLVKKEGDAYHVKFPNLTIPVIVDENLYKKMLHSSEYVFGNENVRVRTYSYSA